MELKITSPSFQNGGMIPGKYSYNNENVSPPLEWSALPSNAKSIALICDDPDAPSGDWVHWVIFNIPAGESRLPENIPQKKTLDNGVIQGINDFRNTGYDGPTPPSGTHRYQFKIFALDNLLSLNAGATKSQLLKAMTGHILAQGLLEGKYRK